MDKVNIEIKKLSLRDKTLFGYGVTCTAETEDTKAYKSWANECSNNNFALYDSNQEERTAPPFVTIKGRAAADNALHYLATEEALKFRGEITPRIKDLTGETN